MDFTLVFLLAAATGIYLGFRLFGLRKHRREMRKQYEDKRAVIHRGITDAEEELYGSKDE